MRSSLLSILVFLLTVGVGSNAEAKTTKEILSSEVLSKNVKVSILKLLRKNQILLSTEWSDAAVETLAGKTEATQEEVMSARENSELSTEELLKEMDSLSVSDKARKARPLSTPEGALYVDFYQESPVLINYVGEGNVVKKMSFGVVYKYLKNDEGKIVPHFVRASLVSPGAEGHRTSIGEFNIDSRHRYYVSNTYGSRMDYAQFFIGGIALHQTPTENYLKLGMPASHGCVRHHEFDADAMWNLIGEAEEDDNFVNVKVYPFGVDVVLADGSKGTETLGMGEKLNEWINNSIECTRRDVKSSCTKSWELWD